MNTMEPLQFSCYFNDGIFELGSIINHARTDLADVDFDTLVGTGFSGGVVIPALAHALGKHYVLIRKEGDDSHHGGGQLIGALGNRWLFVDDFVGSGATRTRVIDKIQHAVTMRGFIAEHVGEYLYNYSPGSRLRDPSGRLFGTEI